MSGRTLYLDASALVKLSRQEPESAALVDAIETDDLLATSILGEIETSRALARAGADAATLATWEHVRERLHVIALADATGLHAAQVPPPSLRTLDAIHLATALRLAPELDAFVAYDRRLGEAALALGLPVASPGVPT